MSIQLRIGQILGIVVIPWSDVSISSQDVILLIGLIFDVGPIYQILVMNRNFQSHPWVACEINGITNLLFIH